MLVPVSFFLFATWLIYPIAALFGTMTAAAITGRDASADVYRLMRQTPISGTTIVWGYIFATLYRLRALLALMVALLPAQVIGSASRMQYLLSNLGIRFIFAIWLWGVFILGVVVGVSEGLLHKKVFPGVIAAPLVVILIMSPLVCGSRSLFYLLSEFPMVGTTLGFLAISFILILLSPYLLSLLFFRLASRWA